MFIACEDWVNGAPTRRLINIGDIGDGTKDWGEKLHEQLPETLILDGFPSADKKVPRTVRRSQIVYIRSNVGHLS